MFWLPITLFDLGSNSIRTPQSLHVCTSDVSRLTKKVADLDAVLQMAFRWLRHGGGCEDAGLGLWR